MADQEKRKLAIVLFQKGSEAVQRNNLDYAIDCFWKCAKFAPDELRYRQALRAAERSKYKNNKTGASMASVRMAGSKTQITVARQRKKWVEVIEHAEEALKLNPWDVDLSMEIARSCQHLEEANMLPVGVWVLEAVREVGAKRADLFKLLGELYAGTEQFHKAVEAYETAYRIDPKDHESKSRAHELAAQDTLQRGKYEDEGEVEKQIQLGGKQNEQSFEDDDEGGRPADSFEARIRRDIAELEKKIAEDPSNVARHSQIGDAWRKLEDFEKAYAAYKAGFEASNQADSDIRIKSLEVQIEPYRRRLRKKTEQKEAVEKSGDAEKIAELKKRIKELTGEVIKREMKLYHFRIETNAEDYEAHYELGYRWLQAGKHDDAIKNLQQARNDANHKWEAEYWLGFAFWKKGNLKLAQKNYEEAQADAPEDDEDAKKRILYDRGRVAEDGGDSEAAQDFYNEIAAIDYGFKDVAKRLDQLNE